MISLQWNLRHVSGHFWEHKSVRLREVSTYERQKKMQCLYEAKTMKKCQLKTTVRLMYFVPVYIKVREQYSSY